MSFFNPEIPIKEKVVSHHPWEKFIKDAYSATYKYGHNSAKNPVYPPKKEKVPSSHRVKFTVIGNRVTKEFIYCMNLVKGLHKYRCRHFDAPVIRGVTGVEWPKVWNDLKIKYGGMAHCFLAPVAVILNDRYLGGDKELKELVESKYIYYIRPDYYREAITQVKNYITSSGRSIAYMHISIDDVHIGTLIFMLYSDIVPRTCENFLRLCNLTKGGYAGTPVHRIVSDCWIQCGGFGLKSVEMDCENFIVPHDRRGVLGMANYGRHVDCSTQFFVLLQPAPWMAYKYVAFGQLIDGEETLQKIEEVPTWYESPTRKICIFKSGILNMECQDITINKGTNEYIQGHIENLFTIGELFYEAVLEKVFVKIDIRQAVLEKVFLEIEDRNRRLSELNAEGEDGSPEDAAKNIHATQRFMRNKEEIDKQLEKSIGSQVEKENNDFDVEEYEYELEEYSYKQVSVLASASVVVKPEKPFYIPLTDVPYPGEVDSTYDLKKVLKGDYCLEADLDKNIRKKKKTDDHKLSFPSELFDMLLEKTSSAESEDQKSLDSEDEREIQKYLKNNADRISFAGNVVKAMGGIAKLNLFEKQRRSELITDDELRKLRLASMEYKAHREKKVSISLPSGPDQHKEIKRRQTGFVRPEDLARIRQFRRASANVDEEDDYYDEEDEDEMYQTYTRHVSVIHPDEPDTKKTPKQVKRRQTSFARPGDLEKNVFKKTSSEMLLDAEEEEERQGVSISPTAKAVSGGSRPLRRPTGFVRPSELATFDDDDEHDEAERPSVLARLFDNMEVEEQEVKMPTLKDYKPMSEVHTHKNSLFLTHSPSFRIKDELDSRERYKRHSISMDGDEKSVDHVLNLQHGKKVARKISSDYVKTIDQIEHKLENSIRSVEYAKVRPAMSVLEYQKKNQLYKEQLSKSKMTMEANVVIPKPACGKKSEIKHYGE